MKALEFFVCLGFLGFCEDANTHAAVFTRTLSSKPLQYYLKNQKKKLKICQGLNITSVTSFELS